MASDRLRVATDLAARGPADIERIARALHLPAPPRIDVYVLPRQGEEEPIGPYSQNQIVRLLNESVERSRRWSRANSTVVTFALA